MKSRRTLTGLPAVALLALALAIAGCGGDADDDGGEAPTATASPTTGDSTEVATPGDGNDSATAREGTDDDDATGSGDAEDFPIAAPDGIVLDALVDAGLDLGGQRQLYYDGGDFDRIVAFYDDWTGDNGEWARTDVEGTVVYQRIDGDGIRTVTITPDQDAGAQAEGPLTFVLLIAD